MTERIERDSIGERSIPAQALYGINALRGSENFDLGGLAMSAYPYLLRSMAQIKKAAARANERIGALDPEKARPIAAACDEIIAGQHAQEFIVTLLEGSGGTSINMNTNEVVANRALQISGYRAGEYESIHPNEHVNLGQSTNDVVPSAIKLAAHDQSDELVQSLGALADALERKSEAFADILRVGRTCMQAAQPMTGGQAFGGYAAVLRRAKECVELQRRALLTLPLGGTAIGTGLGSAPGYREAVYEELREITGQPVTMSDNVFDGMQNADGFARFSSELRVTGDVLGKIASDLIILSSGPNSGIGEVRLPSVQAGSSIMAGKINPVMPMMILQIAYIVNGNDTATSMAALGGQLEINHFEPVIATRLFESIDLLSKGACLFRERCIEGISLNRQRCYENLRNSAALATIFIPTLGYSTVSQLVKEADQEERPFITLAIDRGLISEDEVELTLRTATAYPFRR